MNVWDVEAKDKTDEAIAAEGLSRMEAYMQEIGVTLDIKSLGVTEDMLSGIAQGIFVMNGGYKTLTQEDIMQVLSESM